jgi:hypothetical protein
MAEHRKLSGEQPHHVTKMDTADVTLSRVDEDDNKHLKPISAKKGGIPPTASTVQVSRVERRQRSAAIATGSTPTASDPVEFWFV